MSFNTTFVAIFTKTEKTTQFTVTWIVNGVSTTETYAEGATPVFPNGTPTKPEDASYTYTFTGWDKEIVAATEDTTYTAQFEAKQKLSSIITLSSRTLLLEELVQVRYKFNINGSYTSDYLKNNAGILVWLESDIAEGKVYEHGTESYAVVGLKQNGKIYQVDANGVPAKKLGDKMYARGYIINAKGEYEYTEIIDFNPKTYAQAVMAQTAAAYTAYHPLIVAMMNYGAAAQVYFKYKTDDLMNAWLTADQQKLAAYDASQIEELETDTSKFTMTPTLTVTKVNRALELQDNIWPKWKFTLNSAEVANATEMKLVYWSEDAYKAATELTLENATGMSDLKLNGSQYEAVVKGTAPKRNGRTYYACAYVKYADGTYRISDVSLLSIHFYASNFVAQNSDVGALCRAIVNYSYEAEKKFG